MPLSSATLAAAETTDSDDDLILKDLVKPKRPKLVLSDDDE